MSGKHAALDGRPTPQSGEVGRLRDLTIAGTYSTGDRSLEAFYIPSLAVSYLYDRMAGYYSSSVLKVTARGVTPFLRNAAAHGGSMRLIVGTQLSPEDVAAVRAGAKGWQEAVTAAAQGADIALTGEGIGDEYLKELGWMVHEGLLRIKVGVPLDAEGHPLEPERARGYFHSKYGVLTDLSTDKVAFIGSENETAKGWLYNHETFSVAKSWLPEVWHEQGEGIEQRFDLHWSGHPDSGWAVMDLADVDDRLLKLVPHDYEPPIEDPIWSIIAPPAPTPEPGLDAARAELVALRNAPAEFRWTAAGTAPATPLPHQSHLVQRVVETFPRGYLLADEVGLGKTIEAGLVIRELTLSGTAQTALLLVPATVMKQWQEELFEKIGLDVPRYVGNATFLDRDDEPVLWAGGNPWKAFPIVLASSHLARRRNRRQEILDAAPWDIVLVDEAHHARRRGSKPTDTPNALLALLHAMRGRQAWKALYLASATPMQMHAHEAWDLISLLDLPGLWGQSAQDFINYFENLRHDPATRTWGTLARMLGDYFSDPQAERDKTLESQAKVALGMANSRKITRLHENGMPSETAKNLTETEIDLLDRWLRRHTPMKDRVFRNTRQTLRDYQNAGVLPPEVVIPYRHVRDEFIPLGDYEQELYDRIERYIRRHYNAYKTGASTQALGFIMTIYRRRLTSSFHAIRESLRKRLDVLEQGKALADLLTEDDQYDVEDVLFEPEEFDASTELLQGEIAELRSFLADLEQITGEDTKATQLVRDLAGAFTKYTSVVVFTQYTDTLDYVRTRIVTAGHTRIGCYSGRGGEVYNPTAKTWDPVTKAQIKEMFRNEEINVLVGTDSMSEGLNLQTSGRLINYDMPWNLMRVEQRIGRVDRIGARYRDIEVSNYFYKGTVEQRVYDGIRQDHGDFTEIVGNAQPVLAAVENAIEQQAMAEAGDLDAQISDLRDAAASLQDRNIKSEDMGGPAVMVNPPDLVGKVTLDDLHRVLTANPLTAPLLTKVHDRGDVYDAAIHGQSFRVTFSRRTADKATDGTTLMTYGSEVLTAVLNATTEDGLHGSA